MDQKSFWDFETSTREEGYSLSKLNNVDSSLVQSEVHINVHFVKCLSKCSDEHELNEQQYEVSYEHSYNHLHVVLDKHFYEH